MIDYEYMFRPLEFEPKEPEPVEIPPKELDEIGGGVPVVNW